jgi:hypothetical protein
MSAVLTPVFEQFVQFFERTATAEEILAFQVSSGVQQRANELIELQSAGQLTDLERAELEQMLYFEQLVSSMKARAYRDLHMR